MSRLVLAFSFLFASVMPSQEKPEQVAQQAAAEWLALLDTGKYAQSWTDAAELFKSRIKQDDWEARVKQVRDQTGLLKERAVKSAVYSENLPNAPAGRYVVIQYNSEYDKGKFTETVVPMEEAGQWRVSGYFVKPAE
ncbi:MAG: DUF4019 domain-containing protein [Bryobacteraceae bacterium]